MSTKSCQTARLAAKVLAIFSIRLQATFSKSDSIVINNRNDKTFVRWKSEQKSEYVDRIHNDPEVLMKLSMSSSDEKDDLDFNSCQQKDVQKALEFLGSNEENPTNKQLSFVAKEIAVDKAYVYLAVQLGISWADIKIIEIDYQGDVKRISHETLVKWMELKATDSTVYTLLKGLLSIDRHDVIVKFDKQFCNN
ncbi:Hypothetical predicted protein [Mytilus galloprovincialis]|uniref:Death domain-containing protein n=1 Tax=Mytilus galloprovincialis TaxID=29158 RepID=A0A8B6FK66_MYTGA|nr:Hypothetical predicted protein [Mytilus galloprovincialis]